MSSYTLVTVSLNSRTKYFNVFLKRLNFCQWKLDQPDLMLMCRNSKRYEKQIPSNHLFLYQVVRFLTNSYKHDSLQKYII